MEEIDLSEIDPLKWAEVRRRVATVKEYLALADPTAADRERCAAMLDLGAHQFSNLVKAWCAHSDATVLAPSNRRAGISRSRRHGVHSHARDIARQIIAKSGPSAPLAVLTDAIALACTEAGLAPPSRGTVWLLAVEARGARSDFAAEAIVVGRAYLRLPVESGRGIVFPEVVLAAETPTGKVIDIAMVLPSSDFDARRVAEAIDDHQQEHSLPIRAAGSDADAIGRYLRTDVPPTPVTRSDAARMLSDALGKRIGLIELSYRQPSVRPATVMSSGRDRAPSVADAELALIIARERHNAELAIAA